MKAGAIRRLALFFAAMFVANSVAASARACIEGLSAPASAPVHERILVADAGAEQHVCPDVADATGGQTHCSQNHKNDDPKFSKDVPPAVVFAAAPTIVRVWFDPVLAVRSIPPRPLTGPSLTILFGNLRL